MEIEKVTNVDLTGNPQHGFKKNKSSATGGLVLQSIIANHFDINEYVLMACPDLSAAFEIVNVELLPKRLVILGL